LAWLEPLVLLGFGSLFIFRSSLEPQPYQFIKSRKFEALAAFFAIILGLEIVFDGGIISYVQLEHWGIPHPKHFTLLLVEYYLIVLIVIKVIQYTPVVIAKNKNPARLVLSSFLGFIMIGALLLMLPVATVNNQGLSFINALFMSASAVCVTGLAVVDPATQFTFFGQIVLLILIQIGGIGVITFATFLAMYISEQLGVSERHVLQEVVGLDDVRAVSKTLKRIVVVTFSFEFIGALSYYFSWSEEIPDESTRLFFSVFHSISAFCNAGFSLFSNSLADTFNATSWDINLTTMTLIVFGGLGFTSITELLLKFKTIDGRSWRLSAYSKIVLRMTVFLIGIGFISILIMEWNNTLIDYSWIDKVQFALFQSVTTRTAGFNTLDISSLSVAATLFMMTLMSIGGSPSSTAGGIKTTTAYVLFAAMIANIKGKQRLEIAHRTIPNSVVFRAISVLFLAILTSLISVIILSITEPFSFLDILFEQISAFMTVGLSRGITADLSIWGKLVIVFSMFIGRVGLLTFAVAFANKVDSQNYSYPEENIPIN
jgi:potassium uptake TrkH family protein